jgi:hypothetical protein
VVIQDTLQDRKRWKNQYNQIVMVMAFFDILHAIASALVEIPRPTDDELHSTGERGNNASCKAQESFFFNGVD